MNKSFYHYVLNNFKDGKSLITILSEIMNNADSIQFILEQSLKNNIFDTIITFLAHPNKDKLQDIKILKILKRIIKENIKSTVKNKELIEDINISVIKSGYFQYCVQLLANNIQKNNIFSSLMLGNFQNLRSQPFTLYHKFLLEKKLKFKNIEKLIETTLLYKEKPPLMMIEEKQETQVIKQDENMEKS